MLPLKRILCPTDFSDFSFQALQKAGEMASHFGAELCVLHVMEPILTPTSASVAYVQKMPEIEQAARVGAEQELNEVIQRHSFPRIAVRPLVRMGNPAQQIVSAAEEALDQVAPIHREPDSIAASITKAAAQVGAQVGARALVAFTQSGDTARRLAENRSPIPLLAFTPVPEVRSQLALSWGVETFLVPAVQHTDDMVRQVDGSMLGLGRLQAGDYVTIVAGSPPATVGSTNAMRVHRLGAPVPSHPQYGRRSDDIPPGH